MYLLLRTVLYPKLYMQHTDGLLIQHEFYVKAN